MPKLTLSLTGELPDRRDTISLRTIAKYDPSAPRPHGPMMIGSFVVIRRPRATEIYTDYLIMCGDHVAGRQLSMPSVEDCHSAVTSFERAQARASASAAGRAATAIASAKRRSRRKNEVPA